MNRLLFACCCLALLPRVRAQDWDLSKLPAYEPKQKVSGVIRNFGFPMNGLLAAWEKGFAKFQPDARFEDMLPGSDAAAAGLICKTADLGICGREPMLTELEAIYDEFNTELVDLTVASGSYDVRTTWSVMVFVNKDNPLTKLTMQQLDGIFGAERTGGYTGFRFLPEAARTAKEDIRTWGQLGLGGEWADRPIQTSGYAFTGQANFFQRMVFHGGDKWNPNYREYVESGSKMLEAGAAGQSLGVDQMLAELSRDKFGIAWTGMPQGKRFPGVKAIALAANEGGEYVFPTAATVQARTYPLTRSVYIFLTHPAGTPLEPRLKEFLTYVLSRDGQAEVAANKKYLPLTAEAAQQQLARIQ